VAGVAALAAAVAGRPAQALESYEPEYLVRLRERERFARELEIAKGIQDRFLPKVTPQIPGFSLATCCRPAMEVGGDYYDFLPLPDGRWLLLLGDVSGKGVKAAFYMTLTKGILHSIAAVEGNHSEILRRLNRIFGNLTESGIFLTLCAVVLDPPTREVLLVSAGHNPPLLTGPQGVRVLEPRGLVLGVMSDEIFLKSLREVRLRLEPGESLVLYTDGVTEAMNRECQEFGMERLVRVLEERSGRGVEATVDGVLAAVEAFQEGAHQADDLTLLVVKAHES
jgi:sigma-B regulation protein RsbU (phosphoserine phosphatase)